MLLSLATAVTAASLTFGCQDDRPLGIRPNVDVVAQRDTTLAPVADTYIRQGAPNQNQGTETALRLQSSGHNRVLLRWDQQTLTQAVAGGTLVSARLELTIVDNADNWGTSGRTIDLHRLTQAWTELGATWNCAEDSVPTDQTPDCSGPTAWAMDGPDPRPWVATPTATATIRNGQTGVVAFDVTADVAAFLAGTTDNHGWLVKKTNERQAGKAEFGVRELSSGPRLLLSVTASGDTSRPVLPSAFTPPTDSSRIVTGQGEAPNVYFRDYIEVAFDDTTSGITIRRVLEKYRATITGGRPLRDGYVLRVPDPLTRAAWDSLLTAVEQEAGVRWVLPVLFRASPDIIVPGGRYPADGSQSQRDAWFTGLSNATRPRLAVRAPLAWGCETGAYGGSRVDVGVVDLVIDTGQPDIVTSLVYHPVRADDRMVPNLPLQANTPLAIMRRHHGTNVAGNLAAAGGDGIGIAGMMWAARMHFFALSRDGQTPEEPYLFFMEILERAAASGVRALNVSLDLRLVDSIDDKYVKALQWAIERFVSTGSGRLLVLAAGNDTLQTDDRARWAQGFIGRPSLLKAAVARLDPSSLARRRIVVVTGTTATGSFAVNFANFIAGGTDIAAPATNQLMLPNRAETNQDLVEYSGTSYGTPPGHRGGRAVVEHGPNPAG
jgi:hypothetical protein